MNYTCMYIGYIFIENLEIYCFMYIKINNKEIDLGFNLQFLILFVMTQFLIWMHNLGILDFCNYGYNIRN